MAKSLIINIFVSANPSMSSPGMWRHPNDDSSNFDTIEHWIELAQICERGKFSAIFLADYLAFYDVYKGPYNWKLPASEGYTTPKLDPGVIVSAMADATKSLSFGVTFSTIKEDPVLFARRLWSLDHATNGRVGWNIITSYAPAAGRQLLNGPLPSHQERYTRAAKYVDTVLQEFVGIEGLKRPEGPQKVPVLIQAGTSSQGKHLGLEHAEAIFINSWDKTKAIKDTSAIRALAKSYGRDPSDVKILTVVAPIVALTREEAERKVELIRKHLMKDSPAITFSAQSHVDLDKFGWNDPVILGKVEGGQSVTENFIKRGNNYQTKGQIIENGRKITSLVGTPEEIGQWFEDYVKEVDIDGFNLNLPVSHESVSDFVDLVVPELQKRGLFWEDYAVPGGTFRQNLYGGKDHTFFPETHPIHNVVWEGESEEEYMLKVEKWHTSREEFKKL